MYGGACSHVPFPITILNAYVVFDNVNVVQQHQWFGAKADALSKGMEELLAILA